VAASTADLYALRGHLLEELQTWQLVMSLYRDRLERQPCADTMDHASVSIISAVCWPRNF